MSEARRAAFRPVPPGLATVQVLDAGGATITDRAPMGAVDFGD